MRQLKKENLKICFVLGIIFLIVSMFVIGIIQFIQMKQYKKEMNDFIAKITAVVVSSYPDAEQEMINQWKNTNQKDLEMGKEILQKYGIDLYHVIAASNLEKQSQINLKVNLFVILVLGLIFLGITMVINLKKDRKINEITRYLQEIQQGIYQLDIEDNSEGSLSNLKNEIYKITVMLREQASELEKEKLSLSNSLSDISHQLKTPLTSISIMVDALRTNKQMPAKKRQEFIYEITRQLEWINWLVISLLKLSKLEAGTIQFKQEKVIVREVVETVAKNLSIPMDIKNQQLVIQGEPEVSFVGDFQWSVEALLNITKNCMEHTEENKTIQIQYQENTLYTEIKIIDEGKGIPKEDLPHIFERFYKGRNSSADSVGIGLALAKSILEKQGGEIRVQSKEGEGSEFDIRLYKGVL